MEHYNYGIYKLRNIVTGEIYIGQTKRNFTQRWKEHRYELNTNNHNNKHLQNAWLKYGEESFIFTAIHIADELDNLNELEKYYISKYDCYHNGYNLTLGGDGFEYDEEKIDELRSKMLLRKGYSKKQIENAKLLLTQETHLSIKNRNKEICRITGVSENTLNNIIYSNSWSSIRDDLNDKIKTMNEIQNSIIDQAEQMLVKENKTLKEISEILNIKENQLKYMFKKNNIAFTEKNKENKFKKEEDVILNSYENGNKTIKELILDTGYTHHIIHKIMKHNNIDISTKRIKTRVNCEKNCDEKGVSWDIDSQSWFLRVSYAKKQIFIGKFENVKDALSVKKEVIYRMNKEGMNGILNIKNKYAKPPSPKKKIIATHINSGKEQLIDGIGEASRVLDVDRRSIEKVLSGKQKTTKGYSFIYAA